MITVAEKTPNFEAFDDVLAENNRLIVEAGGPKAPTRKQMDEIARYIAEIKKKNRKEYKRLLASIQK